MKKKIIIILIVILVLIIPFLSVKLVNHLLNSSNDQTDIRQLSNLEVISRYNEYVIAIDKHNGELDDYALFKEKNHESYEKQFVFKMIDQTMESRLIVWTEDTIYFFGYQINSYSLNQKDGNPKQEISPSFLFNGPGTLRRIIGIDDNYIYYEFMRNDMNEYYGKVNLELDEVEEISIDEIPNNIKR